jgi:hypothetical protein
MRGEFSGLIARILPHTEQNPALRAESSLFLPFQPAEKTSLMADFEPESHFQLPPTDTK